MRYFADVSARRKLRDADLTAFRGSLSTLVSRSVTAAEAKVPGSLDF
jgi:hypothetical protein